MAQIISFFNIRCSPLHPSALEGYRAVTKESIRKRSVVVAELRKEYDVLHHRVQLIHRMMRGGTMDYALACTYGSKVGALVKLLRGITTVPDGGGGRVLVVSFWGNTLRRIQGILQRCALDSVFYRNNYQHQHQQQKQKQKRLT